MWGIKSDMKSDTRASFDSSNNFLTTVSHFFFFSWTFLSLRKEEAGSFHSILACFDVCYSKDAYNFFVGKKLNRNHLELHVLSDL